MVKALDWAKRDLSTVPGLTTDFLCILGQLSLELSFFKRFPFLFKRAKFSNLFCSHQLLPLQ